MHFQGNIFKISHFLLILPVLPGETILNIGLRTKKKEDPGILFYLKSTMSASIALLIDDLDLEEEICVGRDDSPRALFSVTQVRRDH